MNETLFNKCTAKNFIPGHAAEVGVYFPETSNILGFINTGAKTTLVEPLPDCVKAIRDYFKNRSNVTLYPYAVGENSGTLELFMAESSSFASDLRSSPALINDNYIKAEEKKLTVECRRFDEIDDGTIDLLSIDTEGSEWLVLKYMKSTPSVISVEMSSKHYVNPNHKLITQWMESNNYERWYKDRSDIVYVRKGTFELSVFEKIANMIK